MDMTQISDITQKTGRDYFGVLFSIFCFRFAVVVAVIICFCLFVLTGVGL